MATGLNDPLVGSSAASQGVTPVTCPYCGLGQFVSERRLSMAGHVLLWTGLAIVLISLPLMIVFIGFLTFPVGWVMMIVSLFCKKYVNICVKCKHTF